MKWVKCRAEWHFSRGYDRSCIERSILGQTGHLRYVQKKMWTLMELGKISQKVSKFGHKGSRILQVKAA
jgi:hypothetical protein